MELFMSLFVAALFVVLTPGILVSLPPKGSKLTVAIVHGLVFAVLYHLTHKAVWHYLYEGFKATAPKLVASKGQASSSSVAATMKKANDAKKFADATCKKSGEKSAACVNARASARQMAQLLN